MDHLRTHLQKRHNRHADEMNRCTKCFRYLPSDKRLERYLFRLICCNCRKRFSNPQVQQSGSTSKEPKFGTKDHFDWTTYFDRLCERRGVEGRTATFVNLGNLVFNKGDGERITSVDAILNLKNNDCNEEVEIDCLFQGVPTDFPRTVCMTSKDIINKPVLTEADDLKHCLDTVWGMARPVSSQYELLMDENCWI